MSIQYKEFVNESIKSEKHIGLYVKTIEKLVIAANARVKFDNDRAKSEYEIGIIALEKALGHFEAAETYENDA